MGIDTARRGGTRCVRPGCPDRTSSTYQDMDGMLDLLRRLPQVSGISPSAADYFGDDASPVEVRVELELSPESPHVDFVDELIRLCREVSHTAGVLLPPDVLDRAQRFLAHASAVSIAWAAVEGAGSRKLIEPPIRGTEIRVLRSESRG